ncbi:MAG: hypothetical protein QXN59_02460 [Candidatus Micrarchaeaceae archaeon]
MSKKSITFDTDISKLHFVPDALPDINLSEIEIETEEKIGSSSVRCVPVAIEVEDEASAISASLSTGHKEFYLTGSSELVFVSGSIIISRSKEPKVRRVSNGLELAKCLRLGIRPCTIENGTPIKQIGEQLRITMFLINAKNITELKKAEVYAL